MVLLHDAYRGIELVSIVKKMCCRGRVCTWELFIVYNCSISFFHTSYKFPLKKTKTNPGFSWHLSIKFSINCMQKKRVHCENGMKLLWFHGHEAFKKTAWTIKMVLYYNHPIYWVKIIKRKDSNRLKSHIYNMNVPTHAPWLPFLGDWPSKFWFWFPNNSIILSCVQQLILQATDRFLTCVVIFQDLGSKCPLNGSVPDAKRYRATFYVYTDAMQRPRNP